MFDKTITYVCIFGLLILARCVWIPNGENATHFITGVNCLSYLLVIMSIRRVVRSRISEDIKTYGDAYSSQVNKSEYKKRNKKVIWSYIVMCMVLIYFILRSSDKNNDVLSIITIAVSLLYEEIGCMIYSFEREMRK